MNAGKMDRKIRVVQTLMMALVMLLSPTAFASKTINFQFTDTTGNTLRLSDFHGKWVLVNFWAPWCPLCWAEVPLLNALNKRGDVVVIGVSLDYGPFESVVMESAKSHNLSITAIVAGGSRRDPDGPFTQVGPVDFYPTSYLYDPTGELVMLIPGQVKKDKLQAYMENWNLEREQGSNRGYDRLKSDNTVMNRPDSGYQSDFLVR